MAERFQAAAPPLSMAVGQLCGVWRPRNCPCPRASGCERATVPHSSLSLRHVPRRDASSALATIYWELHRHRYTPEREAEHGTIVSRLEVLVGAFLCSHPAMAHSGLCHHCWRRVNLALAFESATRPTEAAPFDWDEAQLGGERSVRVFGFSRSAAWRRRSRGRGRTSKRSSLVSAS